MTKVGRKKGIYFGDVNVQPIEDLDLEGEDNLGVRPSACDTCAQYIDAI